MGKHTKQRTFEYISVVEAAKYINIGLNSMYNAIHDREITPDLILWTEFKDRRPEVHKYLFLKQTLLNWKRERDRLLPTKKACLILNMTLKQVLYRIHTGKLIPDKVKKITKGRRGSYYYFFFYQETLDAYLATPLKNEIDVELSEAHAFEYSASPLLSRLSGL